MNPVNLVEPLRPILKNTAHLLGARGSGMVVRGLYAVVLARFLGPEQFGLFAYALGWYVAFIPFTSLGLGAVISRDAGQSQERGRHTMQQALALRGGLGLLAAGACGVLGWMIHPDATTRYLLVILSIALMGRSLAIMVENIFNAFSASRYVFSLEAKYRTAEVALGIAVLLSGGTLLQLAGIHALIWWLQGIHGISLFRKKFFPLQPEWDRVGLRRLLRKGGLLAVQTFLLGWFAQGPILLGRHFGLDLSALGQLALLVQVFGILGQIPGLVAAAALPVLSRQSVQKDNLDRELVGMGLQISWLAGTLAALIGWLAGPLLVSAIFGAKYAEAGAYFGAMLYLLVPWSWGNMLSLRMFARGFLRKATLSVVAGSAVFTLAFAPFAEAWSLAGILGALALGLWLWVVLQYFFEGMNKSLLLSAITVNLATFAPLLLTTSKTLAFVLALFMTLYGFWFFLVPRSQRQGILTRITLR